MDTNILPNIHIEQEYHTLEEKKLFLEQEAQRMRENPTEGEKLFKDFCDRYNITYTCQKPVIVGYKGFIIDFEIISKGNPKTKGWKSAKRKIAVEIDGEYHNTKEQKEKDNARSKTLNGAMYKVIRFTNEEVKDDMCIFRKFLEFLPKIKETTLYKKLSSKLNSSIIEKNLKAAIPEIIDEKAYLTYRYNKLVKEYEELEKWALEVKSLLGDVGKSCPVSENVVHFF